MTQRVTRENVETAFKYFVLAFEFPSSYALLKEGRYYQIIHRVPGQNGYTLVFGHNKYTAREMYNVLWFAQNALEKSVEVNALLFVSDFKEDKS